MALYLACSLVVSGQTSCTETSDNDRGSAGAAAEPQALETAPLTPDGYVLTPGGWVMHASCVHEVENGSTISRGPNKEYVSVDKRGNQTTYPPCDYPITRRTNDEASRGSGQPPAIGHAWIEYSCAQAPANGGRSWFNKLSGRWTVPSAPATNGGLIFFFNSLQDVKASCVNNPTVSPTEIIQPVLQYGSNGSFGGNYWQVASWIVGPDATGGAFHSPRVLVNPGDAITGDINGFPCTVGGRCTYVVTAGAPTDTSVITTSTLTKVFDRADQGVLEVYNVNSCSNLHAGSSDSIWFNNTYLYQPPPTGNQNTQVEMYSSASWLGRVTPGLTPSCSYSVTNVTRGTTLAF